MKIGTNVQLPVNSSQQLLTYVIDKGHLNFLGIYTILLRYAIHVLLLVVRIVVPTVAHALCLHINSHIIIMIVMHWEKEANPVKLL